MILAIEKRSLTGGSKFRHFVRREKNLQDVSVLSLGDLSLRLTLK